MERKTSAIILALDEDNYMCSEIPKVLHKVLGESMISHVITAVKGASANDITLVGCEEIKNNIMEDIFFVAQNEHPGTGNAVMMADNYLNHEGDVIILCGNTPLITKATLENLLEVHREDSNIASMISVVAENPDVKEINTGVYCFRAQELKAALKEIADNNPGKQYSLTDALEIITKKNLKVGVLISKNYEEFLEVNDRVQLHIITQIMKNKINTEHMLNGVTFIDENSTFIGPNVTINMDTIIYPGTIIEGDSKIGSNCIIGSNCKIIDSEIDNNTEIDNSVIMQSKVGKNTHVGPFAYLRPNSNIGDNVKIGDFVEVKNSSIGNGTKVSHLTYIGDAEVGNKINFGCGTVVVNYDGNKKYRTVIEDNVFIGCNTNLVAPVTVKKGSFIAAGSTITEDVPEKTFAIARSRQINKTNWKKTTKE